MALKNAYPEKPLIPYKRTTVEMAQVIKDIRNTDSLPEQKRMAYIMARNEGANGQSGVNNNYCGFQADGGRWDSKFDSLISGVVSKIENGTGKQRLFLAFNDVSGCIEMLLDRVKGRGLYVGGTTHKIWKDHFIMDATDLCSAYIKEWVRGSANATPSPDELKNFLSMYKQATVLFP